MRIHPAKKDFYKNLWIPPPPMLLIFFTKINLDFCNSTCKNLCGYGFSDCQWNSTCSPAAIKCDKKKPKWRDFKLLSFISSISIWIDDIILIWHDVQIQNRKVRWNSFKYSCTHQQCYQKVSHCSICPLYQSSNGIDDLWLLLEDAYVLNDDHVELTHLWEELWMMTTYRRSHTWKLSPSLHLSLVQ